jgi:hypothetical protein
MSSGVGGNTKDPAAAIFMGDIAQIVGRTTTKCVAEAVVLWESCAVVRATGERLARP